MAIRTRRRFSPAVLEHHARVAPIGGNLSPMVEATLLDPILTAPLLLHLVNGSGHFDTSSFEPIEMRDLEVAIPFDGEPSRITGLVGARECAWTASDGHLTILVPELGLFEALQIYA